MMNISTTRAFRRGWFALAFLLLILTGGGARAGDLKLEAQLVWGTNDEKSPDPKLKPVEADVRKKLADLPLKWSHYFEVNRERFDVAKGAMTKAALNQKCAVEVKSLDGRKVEVVWFGKKGEVVGRQTQPLAKGEMLVLGGNAPNATSWLLILKRLE
ncbi:MAG: hypothetical protein MUF81_02260 [Verrucomicrobia bacterium]|nr:hypothetical protein [Verrucomicrobiota bacterium]